MRNLLITVALLVAYATAQGQGDYRYRYWFDGRDDAAVTVSGLAAGIDAGMLTDNMHTLYMQVADGQGVWSSPVARLFVKTPAEGGPQLVYWFHQYLLQLHASGAGLEHVALGRAPGNVHEDARRRNAVYLLVRQRHAPRHPYRLGSNHD